VESLQRILRRSANYLRATSPDLLLGCAASLALRQHRIGKQSSHLGRGTRAVRTVHEPAVQVRSEQLRELVHVLAQQRAAPEADPGGVRGEHVRGIDRDQVRILRIDRHVRDDPDPEPEPHVRLDDIGIARGDRDVRTERGARERLVQR